MKVSNIAAIDFFDDLSSGYARKWFFLIMGGGVLGCLLLIWAIDQFTPSGTFKEITHSVLVQLTSSGLIIIAFYSMYVYLIGPNTGLREVSVTRSQDIGNRLQALPLGVRHYMFWGRAGSYFRAEPLLKLDEQARESKRNISIEVLLPDPDDARLVSSYRDILKSLGEDGGDNPLLPNVLATCLACAIIGTNNRHLDIRIHVSQFLPAFRLDLSDNGAILTQDDKKKSALYFEFGSEFYDMFRSTVSNEQDVSREIRWDKELFRGLKLEAKSCSMETLTAFGFECTNIDLLQQSVAALITDRQHRYK